MAKKSNQAEFTASELHAHDIEKGVIGAVLINPQVYWDMSHMLSEKDFHSSETRRVWNEIKGSFSQGIEPDLMIISDRLDNTGFPNSFNFLSECVASCNFSLQAVEYAKVLQAYTTRRKILWVGTQLAQLAHDMGHDLEGLVGRFSEIQVKYPIEPSSGISGNTQTADEASLELMNRIMSGEATGINSGFGEFDDYVHGLGGFPRGGITLFLGDSSFGKSSWVIQLSEQVAFQGGKVIIFGYEQPNESNVSRRVFGNTGINYKKLRSGQLTEKEKELLQAEIVNNYQGRFTKKGGDLLFNSRDMTLAKIKSEIRKHRPDFVVIDQFKFIRDTTDNGNITQSYIYNMTELKNFAKEFNCHVIAVQPITAEESKKFLEANAKANNGTQSGANVKNVMPDVNAISWAKELKFIADIILFVVPEVHTKFGQQVKLTNMKMIIWILKDRDGDRFLKTFWDFDLVKQWWANEKPPQTSAQRPSAVTAPKMQSAPPPAQVMPEPPEPPDYEFEDMDDGGG